jgi:hypothetical protein
MPSIAAVDVPSALKCRSARTVDDIRKLAYAEKPYIVPEVSAIAPWAGGASAAPC